MIFYTKNSNNPIVSRTLLIVSNKFVGLICQKENEAINYAFLCLFYTIDCVVDIFRFFRFVFCHFSYIFVFFFFGNIRSFGCDIPLALYPCSHHLKVSKLTRYSNMNGSLNHLVGEEKIFLCNTHKYFSVARVSRIGFR